jgi:hypothetical protein
LYSLKPIVDQFCHQPSDALSSGLDSFSQDETGRSQSGKKIETFAIPDRSSEKKVRCDWCNLCYGSFTPFASTHWAALAHWCVARSRPATEIGHGTPFARPKN